MNHEPYTLITGASSGIGKAMAFQCGGMGMNLLLVSLPGEGLNTLAESLARQFNITAHSLELDLTEPGGPAAVFDWTRSQAYDVAVLINNAGVAGASVFEQSDMKYIDDRILLNIRALVFLTRLFIPELRRHPESHILNVGSMAGFFPIPFKSLYSASKAFVLTFSRSLRSELKGSGISISVLCPNGVQTNATTVERIRAHGKIGNWTKVDVNKVASIGLQGMLHGKFLIIPGRINYFFLLLKFIIPLRFQQYLLQREFLKEVKRTA